MSEEVLRLCILDIQCRIAVVKMKNLKLHSQRYWRMRTQFFRRNCPEIDEPSEGNTYVQVPRSAPFDRSKGTSNLSRKRSFIYLRRSRGDNVARPTRYLYSPIEFRSVFPSTYPENSLDSTKREIEYAGSIETLSR